MSASVRFPHAFKTVTLLYEFVKCFLALALRRGVLECSLNLFQSNVYMKKLNLSWNGFGLEGATALQDTLKGNSVLEELDIS